jgi:hypothetical protein
MHYCIYRVLYRYVKGRVELIALYKCLMNFSSGTYPSNTTFNTLLNACIPTDKDAGIHKFLNNTRHETIEDINYSLTMYAQIWRLLQRFRGRWKHNVKWGSIFGAYSCIVVTANDELNALTHSDSQSQGQLRCSNASPPLAQKNKMKWLWND